MSAFFLESCILKNVGNLKEEGWKSETRIRSYEFRHTSYEFKPTIYEFKFTS